MALEGLYFLYIIFNIEHRNCHKLFLLHYVLLNRHLSRLLQCKFWLVIATVSVGLDVGLEIIMWPLALKNFFVLGLGLEKKVLALVS